MTAFPFNIDSATVQTFVATAIPRMIAALAVLFLTWLALRITQPALRMALHRAHFVEGLIRLLVDGLYRGVVIVLGLIMAASQLGINVSALLAGLGVAGVALGFAAQETVANMIAGFLIFWDRPFVIGDYITTQNYDGDVREITLRTTRIRTLNNTYVVVPNKQIIGDTVVNHSMYGETRVVVPIGIAYKESIAAARQTMLAVLGDIQDVLSTPPPDVVARSLGDSSVNLEARVWIARADLEKPVTARVVEACKNALDKAGIEIPFPHLQLFVDQVDDRVWSKAAQLIGAGGNGRQ
jgi:small conductance mechanosensitive channel